MASPRVETIVLTIRPLKFNGDVRPFNVAFAGKPRAVRRLCGSQMDTHKRSPIKVSTGGHRSRQN